MKPAVNPTYSTCPLYVLKPAPERKLREETEFYVPELLTDADYDVDHKAYAAFEEHDQHVHKAQGPVGDAWNLASLMRSAIGYEYDDRAMQTDAGLKVIEKKLAKAHDRIDRLGSRYKNLFFAYCVLKAKHDRDAG